MIQEAGAIVLREGKVLLIRSNKKPHVWLFPKGHIEADEGKTGEETALRELEEETGIVGLVLRPVGPLIFVREQQEYEVQYFLVDFVGAVEAYEKRKWFWCPVDKAFNILTFPNARMLLTDALTCPMGTSTGGQ